MPRTLDDICWPAGVPWSYSALTQFESCELQYGAIQVLRQFEADFDSDALRMGNEQHRLLERFVSVGETLPPGLTPVGEVVKKMMQGATRIMTEAKLSLTHEIKPCRSNDPDVSYRGKLDLVILRPTNQSIIVDYKSSSEPREDFEQLELNAMAHLISHPEVTRAHCYYLYTRGFPPRKTVVDRGELPALANSYIPRLKRLGDARSTKIFSASPYYGCRWCPVITCIHNPKAIHSVQGTRTKQ